jgi:signal transduction histidine kinase
MDREGIRAYAGLPIMLGDRGCGALSVFHRSPWPPGMLDALTLVARQAALAIEQARLLEETQTLQAIAAEVAAARDPQALLQSLVQRSRAAFGADGCAVWLLDKLTGMLTPGAADGLSQRFIDDLMRPRATNPAALFGVLESTRQPLFTQDDQAAARARNPDLAAALAAEGIVSALRLPLVEAGDEVVGMLALYHRRERLYSESEVRLAQAFTDQIAVTLHNARLAEKERQARVDASRQLERLRAVTQITERLIGATELSEVLDIVVEAASRLCDASSAMVGLIDEGGRRISAVAFEGEPRRSFEQFRRPAIDAAFLADTAAGQAIARRQPVVVEDYAAWPARHETQQETLRLGVRAFIVAPLLIQNEPVGVLWVNDVRPRSFRLEDVALAQALADQAALAIDHARLVQRSQDAAVLEERTRLARDLHDSVTQSVFSLGMMARAAQVQHDRGSDRLGGTLERIAALSQDALKEMRALLFELQPTGLSEEGLAVSLERLAEAFRSRMELQVSYQGNSTTRLPSEMETAIFRIVQEALANAAKHSHAGTIAISLDETPDRLRVVVRDDGVGFDLGAPVVESPDGRRGGMGMRTMRERASAAGLEFGIRSRPGQGTSVMVDAPLVIEAAGAR